LKLCQFVFYQGLQYPDAFLLIRIVGSETLQLPDCLIDVLYRRTIRLEVGFFPREEIASLSGFCIGEPADCVIERIEDFVGVLSLLSSLSESARVPVGLPSSEYQNGRCY